MQIKILGCGASSGVPAIGCSCDVCKSSNPKNKRSRASIYVSMDDVDILVDTSPDLRMQAIDNDITNVSAVLYTHTHFDHTCGLDEVRAFNLLARKDIPVYSTKEAIEDIKNRFSHAFEEPSKDRPWLKPRLEANIIDAISEFSIGEAKIQSFAQYHGDGKSLGFRFGNVVYSTDVTGFPEESEKYLQNIEVWIIDCLKYGKTGTHLNLQQSLSFIEKYKPKKAIMTHMSHEFDYDKFLAELPDNIEPAYDGMIININ